MKRPRSAADPRVGLPGDDPPGSLAFETARRIATGRLGPVRVADRTQTLNLCDGMRRRMAPQRQPMTWSAIDCGHVGLVVALAGGRGETVEPLDLLCAQLDAVGSGVLLDAGDALGAGDRGDVVALCEQPGQSDLRR